MLALTSCRSRLTSLSIACIFQPLTYEVDDAESIAEAEELTRASPFTVVSDARTMCMPDAHTIRGPAAHDACAYTHGVAACAHDGHALQDVAHAVPAGHGRPAGPVSIRRDERLCTLCYPTSGAISAIASRAGLTISHPPSRSVPDQRHERADDVLLQGRQVRVTGARSCPSGEEKVSEGQDVKYLGQHPLQMNPETTDLKQK
ncbi:hypothetical protein GGX14DRAFT_407433 [Mycena pura]|uniref:Uncharacterized protein n=1 Tax=Mycena pura TaxID=153505 RepID=A0AAD6UNJ7_9AGAR|nr:hypothetical protein GGX14DRAFT_407433 [Mycena pura]